MFATPEKQEQCAAEECGVTLTTVFDPAGDPTLEPVVFDQADHERMPFCRPEHAVATLNPGRADQLARQLFRVRMALFMRDAEGLRLERAEVENIAWGAYGDYQLTRQLTGVQTAGDG